MQDRAHVERSQSRINYIGEHLDPHFKQCLQRVSYDIKGQEKNGQHDAYEAGDRGKSPREDLVQFDAPDSLYALVRFHNCRAAHFLNKSIAHIRDRRRAVQASLFFHLNDQVLTGFQLVRLEPERVDHPLISLDHLGRRKSHRGVDRFTVVFDQVHDRMNASVHRPAVIIRPAEVLP